MERTDKEWKELAEIEEKVIKIVGGDARRFLNEVDCELDEYGYVFIRESPCNCKCKPEERHHWSCGWVKRKLLL